MDRERMGGGDETADEMAGRHLDEYQAGMVEHDLHIGQFLDKLDELDIADDTVVFYSTDNGPHMNTWPDAAMTPFWGEKNTQWEGAWRVPAMVRWPGRIEEGSINNEIVHHMDWLPTFAAIAGEPEIKEKLKEGGVQAIGREYKVHLDGYNIMPLLIGETDKSPREEIFYFTDDGDLAALRWNDWKLTFLEQKAWATFRAWMEPLTPLRVPLIAAINGPAIGLGCDLACLADMRIASRNAKFGVTFLKLGLVPGDGGPLNGFDALLSTVQMPKGVPVATVAIGKAGAINAGYLAAQMLSTGNEELAEKVKNLREEQKEALKKENEEL